MNLYRFLSNHIETHYIVAENGKAAVEAVEATGSLYDMIFLEAEEKALPGGSVAKLVIIPAAPVPMPDAKKDARIAALERKLAELTAAAEALLSHNGYGSPENRNQHFELQAKLRAVLDAQRGEKKEAKP